MSPGSTAAEAQPVPYTGTMGTFEVDVEISDREGRRFEALRALVDTGSTYVRVPGSILRSLDIQPSEHQRFEMADGRVEEYPIGEAKIRFENRTRFTVVAFGEDDSGALLGAVALESFGFAVDPIGQRLVPVVGLMM